MDEIIERPRRPSIEQVLAFVDIQRANHEVMTARKMQVLADRWLARAWPVSGLRAIAADAGGGEVTLTLVEAR